MNYPLSPKSIFLTTSLISPLDTSVTTELITGRGTARREEVLGFKRKYIREREGWGHRPGGLEQTVLGFSGKRDFGVAVHVEMDGKTG